MKRLALGFGTLVMAATVAMAHEGVKDPLVKARMDLMGEIKENTGTLGNMLKGKIPFDAAQAEAARLAQLENAKAIPAAFETQATDPKSEAAPAIWTGWDDFVAKTNDMITAVEAADASSLDSLRGGMGAIGGSCKACHKSYRID